MPNLKINQKTDYIIDEVAQRFDVTSRTVYRWLTDGKLSGQKVGRSWHISSESIESLARSRTREQRIENTTDFVGKGHYLVLAPERDALAGTVLKLIELGLRHEYNVFCGCWTQSIQEQYELGRKMGLPLDKLEQEGRFFPFDFASTFAESHFTGTLDQWQAWATLSQESTRSIMGIQTPDIHQGDKPLELIAYESALDKLWQPVQAISFCVYSLADFVPEQLHRLGSLVSHHDGLIMWGENGSIVLERSIPLYSIFAS